MSNITAAASTVAAAQIAATFDDVFAMIDAWKGELSRHLLGSAASTAPAVDALVESFALPAVTGDGLITGAGFVCAPGLLPDAAWHLAWWLAGPTGPRRLATVDDPSSEQFRDYTALEWWRVPARSGRRHLTGPYVDYVCTEDYTITVTTPVLAGARMLGVVGVDLLVDRLERELLPLLPRERAAATLVNSSGRVVAASDARREPGSILRLDGLAEALRPLHDEIGGVDAVTPAGYRVVSCGETSLALVLES